MLILLLCHIFFFFNDTATTEIYTLSLHDALPISPPPGSAGVSAPGLVRPLTGRSLVAYRPRDRQMGRDVGWGRARGSSQLDRKSTRLKSSHLVISYAVFCLKKKNTNTR